MNAESAKLASKIEAANEYEREKKRKMGARTITAEISGDNQREFKAPKRLKLT